MDTQTECSVNQCMDIRTGMFYEPMYGHSNGMFYDTVYGHSTGMFYDTVYGH